MSVLNREQRADIQSALNRAIEWLEDGFKAGGDPAKSVAASEIVANLTRALCEDDRRRSGR